jgi:hypothetical protein
MDNSNTKMPEPVPLGTGLCVQRQDIVIHRPRRLVMDFLFERNTIEARDLWLIQTPIRRYSDTMDYLPRRSNCVVGRQPVEHSQLISWAKKSPRISTRSVFLERKRFKRRGSWQHFELRRPRYGGAEYSTYNLTN